VRPGRSTGGNCARTTNRADLDAAQVVITNIGQRVRSSFLSGRWVQAPPMLGDLVASADPDPVVAQDVIVMLPSIARNHSCAR
jgi:hypothetical protein